MHAHSPPMPHPPQPYSQLFSWDVDRVMFLRRGVSGTRKHGNIKGRIPGRDWGGRQIIGTLDFIGDNALGCK